MKTFLRAGAAAALLLATLGAMCPQESLGLVQTVSVEPAEPRTGDQVTIRTQVRNAGTVPRHGSFKICGLLFAGDLALSDVPGTMRCGGYSAERDLAPGETVEDMDTKVVDSAPGTYVLEVRHLLDPAMSHKVTVRVLPR